MKITTINSSKDILKYLVGSIYIGKGKTAMCFLRPDGNVIKVFYSYKRDKMKYFKNFDILTNETYKAPNEFLVLNDECAAYIYPYIYAKTFKFMKHFTSLETILKKYDKVYEDTKNISKKNFLVEDIHEKNILLSATFYIIDLDAGEFRLNTNIENVFSHNMRAINEGIINSLFDVTQDFILDFYDAKIRELYHKSVHTDYSKFPELLEEFQRRCEPNEYSIYRLRNEVLYSKTHNSFFKYF